MSEAEGTTVMAAVVETHVPLLFGLSFAMFAGAFLAGYAPLSLSISANRMRLITVFGAGILIGTALNVIIPEGLHMWASASQPSHAAVEHVHEEKHQHESAHHDHAHAHDDNWQIGAAIAVGFAFMLLVDRLSGDLGHSHGQPDEAPAAGKSQSAMIGLIVHAAVDGVALGATLFSGAGEATLPPRPLA